MKRKLWEKVANTHRNKTEKERRDANSAELAVMISELLY